jgi:CubicO group peptidase (beta-lactamase class C family)
MTRCLARWFALPALVITLCSLPPARVEAQRAAAAETVAGLSSERLARIDAVVGQYVSDRRIAGAVTLVARNGRVVHLRAHGQQDVERGVPMATDTMFRIASMSKAVTSVAAMILIEEGRLLLTDPVSRFLPSFKQTYVAVPPPPGASVGAAAATGVRVGTVPAKRAITVRDLMTHTAGISYGAGALEAEYKAANIFDWYLSDKSETIGEVVDRLATLPFEAQPGEKWVYGYGTDILGRVVEVASGMTLDEFFRVRIFAPLRMTDTYFFVPPEKAGRLATVYGAGAEGKIQRAPEHGARGQGEYVDGPRKCFSGGAGLVSTITDYARLLQMLLNDGALDGVRILSPASVASMTSNHVGSLYLEGALGFGLGFEVVEHVGRAGRLTAAGELSWGSAYYPRYWVDPSNGVVAILMTQLIPAGGLDLSAKYRSLVYQAIVEPGAPSAAPERTSPRRTTDQGPPR